MVRDSINSTDESSTHSLLRTGRAVIVDIGTGDGRFVYQNARKNPDKFYIGIDASSAALTKLSEKIHRKPEKGGAKNALFVQASVEQLPVEFDGVADEVHIHFPWGSLLKAVISGDETILRSIRKICADDALLEVIIGLDPVRDKTEYERLGVDALSIPRLENELSANYASSGFEITEYGEFPPSQWPDICSEWARKLEVGQSRSLIYLIASATK